MKIRMKVIVMTAVCIGSDGSNSKDHPAAIEERHDARNTRRTETRFEAMTLSVAHGTLAPDARATHLTRVSPCRDHHSLGVVREDPSQSMP